MAKPIELDPYWTTKGRQIRSRLLARSGSSQYRKQDAAKVVVRLMNQGVSIDRIGALMQRTPRQVFNYLAYAGAVADGTDFKPMALKDRAKRMQEWTIEAFEEFFLEFSPHHYFPEHVRSWVVAFLRERNLMLNVPPRHAKSEFFMIWIPTWLICRDRNVQILLVSFGNDDAVNWAREIAGQLETNTKLIETYGRFKPESTKDQRWTPATGTFSVLGRTKTAKGAQFTVESRGITGRVLGREADFVIVDDPTNQEVAASPTERLRHLEHIQQQVFSRAEPEVKGKPGGRVAVIGQRVHSKDMYGELEKQVWEMGPLEGQPLFHVEKYPAVLRWPDKDEKGDWIEGTEQVLWPERFPWKEVMLAYARVGGEKAFWTMYQQTPSPEGAAIFKKAHIDACKDYDRPAGKGFRIPNATMPVVRAISVDPSPTMFNGIVVGDLLWNRGQFACAVVEVHRLKAGVNELKAKVDQLIAIHNPDYLVFEESGFLAWFRDDPWFMELGNRVRFVRHHTGVNKNSLEYGVQSLAGDFELKHISLPYGDPLGIEMTNMLEDEAIIYPDGDIYDCLMALWFLKFNYKALAPVNNMMPTRVRGSGTGKTWPWFTEYKRKKQAHQPHRERVSVGN